MKTKKKNEYTAKDILELSTKENYFDFLEKSKDEEFTCIDYKHELIMQDIFNLHKMHLKSIMLYQKLSKNSDLNEIIEQVEPFDLLDAKAWDFTTYILSKAFNDNIEKASEITC